MPSQSVFVTAILAATFFLAQANGLARSQMSTEPFRIISFIGGSVALPTSWTGTKGSDGQQFIAQAPGGQIRATLSTYYFSTGASRDDDERVFNRFLTLRLRTEKEVWEDVAIGPPTLSTQHDGTITAVFEGRESAARRFTAKLAMRGGTLAVVYLEAVDQDEDTLGTLAPRIFESLTVHQK